MQAEPNLRAVVTDMRSLFDFPGVGKQPGNTFTLPPVDEWRLFYANVRACVPDSVVARIAFRPFR